MRGLVETNTFSLVQSLLSIQILQPTVSNFTWCDIGYIEGKEICPPDEVIIIFWKWLLKENKEHVIIKLLENFLISSVEKWFINVENIFQDNKTSSHKAKWFEHFFRKGI